jgi:hypothetical protein
MEVRMPRYLMCGMKIESDVALADARLVDADDSDTDINVRATSPLEAPAGATIRHPNWCFDDDGLWLDIPTVARLRIAAGGSIEVDPSPQITAESWAPLVTGTALGILLQMRGEIALHASCVVIDGRAIVLCGRAGAGKSVLAAALARRGHAILCDDLCRLLIERGRGVLAMREGPYVKLWPSAAGELGYDKGQPIRPPIGKSRFDCRSLEDPVPVAAIYEMHNAPRPYTRAIEAVSGLAAIGAMSRLTYRPSLIDTLPNGPQRQFGSAVALLQRVPLFDLPYSKTWAPLPDLAASLEAHVDQIPS